MRIQSAFDEAGIRFLDKRLRKVGYGVRLAPKLVRTIKLAPARLIDENGGGPRVRLRKRQRTKQTK